MSLIVRGSTHIGHEGFISVTTLEEDKRFLCVWLFYYVSNFCRFAKRNGVVKISIKSCFMVIIFFSVHLVAVKC